MSRLKIALCQFDMVWENQEKTVAKISDLVSQFSEPYDWIIFPEMALTGFSMDVASTTISDFALNYFRTLAKNKRCFVSFGGVKDKKNTFFTFDSNGNLISSYAKQHLFSLGDENNHYLPGTLPSMLFKIKNCNILPAICYDLRFSYLFWNAAMDTDIYTVIASWPASRDLHWRTLLQARAIENQAFVVGVNRIGSDPKLNYIGSSLVIDPQGNILLDAASKEGIFVCEIDTDLRSETRRKFPFLKDRLKGV